MGVTIAVATTATKKSAVLHDRVVPPGGFSPGVLPDSLGVKFIFDYESVEDTESRASCASDFNP